MRVPFSDALHAWATDKLFVTATVSSIGVAATWELWLKSANNFAAANLPVATFLMICVTILVRLFPRQPSPASETKTAASTAWSAAKRFGLWVGVGLAAIAALVYWTTGAKAAVPQQASAVVGAGKRRRSRDDAGDEGDADEDQQNSDSSGPSWYLKAKSCVGIAEALSSGKANSKVREMFSAVDGFKRVRDDGTTEITADPRKVAWCAVFVNYCLQAVGVSGTRNAMARSFGRSRAFTRLDQPRLGCIVTMWRGEHDDGQTGHVGFYAGEAGPGAFWVLGGNQGDQVKVAKFRTSKLRGGSDLGFWWPRGKLESRTGKGVVVATTTTAAGTGAVAYDALTDDKPVEAAQSTVEQVTSVLEQAQRPLEATGHPKAMKIAAMIGITLCLIGMLAGLYAWYRHSKDHSEGRL